METPIVAKPNTDIASAVIIFFLRWANNYFIANMQTTAFIICIGFLLIADLNFLHGDMSFLLSPQFSQIMKLLGVNISANGVYGPAAFAPMIFRLSFVVLIFNALIKRIISLIFKRNINFRLLGLVQGASVITLLSIVAYISCFTPKAAIGSVLISSFILFFWTVAMSLFGLSLIWSSFTEKIFAHISSIAGQDQTH